MPKKSTTRRAKADARRGKSASTQAGNFVREEMDEIREGKHGAQNAKQAIAIGLSKARKAGVKVGDNPRRPARKKKKAARKPSKASSARRSRASTRALKKKPRAAASHRALSRHAKAVARRKK